MKLEDAVRINRRFSRSANVERDSGVDSIQGYIPTGRAIDVVVRIGRGLSDPSSGRAFSITGPHGGGKSSLAVFLDALFSPQDSVEHQAANQILAAADATVMARIDDGLRSVNRRGDGAIRAFVTAGREPVTATVARALYVGSVRKLGARQRVVPKSFGDPGAAVGLTARDILDVLRHLCADHLVVLVIDEFGKNLEAYAESGREGDPYLLQELAESAQGEGALPLVLVTMQHLAFDEYVQDASAARRREWAKVQGRFQDIPYVETALQSRRLIAATIEQAPSALDKSIARWFKDRSNLFSEVGLRDLIGAARATYPLHPIALALLPELCSRYGQNERTLFSFLAGPEPLALPQFLATSWKRGAAPPFIGLDRVYDYFLDSASTTIGASATASRWLEIEGRIRDTNGLSSVELRTLKTIGVLNLVSSGGSLRASRQLLELALIDGSGAPEDPLELEETLDSLERRGLITYREFADEYRVWQGSDFDLRGSVEIARRECEGRSLASLLNQAAPLVPAVAGRSSQIFGVLRVFDQRFSELTAEDLIPPGAESASDGVVLYATRDDRPSARLARNAKAMIVVLPENLGAMRETAIEVAALRVALKSAEMANADWVARRELVERVSAAAQELRIAVARCWSPVSSTWVLVNDQSEIDPRAGVSSALSVACDIVYSATPRVANEMISRRELTSQGAKARRMLVDAFLARPGIEAFGIVGYGPDRAMYEALFRVTGLHRCPKGETEWRIATPTDRAWRLVWRSIADAFDEAVTDRMNLTDVAVRLKRPPIGLKDGIIPILLVAAIWERSEDIALYEHGSLVLALDDAVAERLARNLGHFTIKNSGAAQGQRRQVVVALSEKMKIEARGQVPTFLQLARALYRELRGLPSYSQQTKANISPSAIAVRTAFRTATEPDTLVFETLPTVLGLKPFPADSPRNTRSAREYAERLAAALRELRASYELLLESIASDLATATATIGDRDEMRELLAGQAINLEGRVLEPKLKTLVGALARQHLESREWLENVAMVVSGGNPPKSWTDDQAATFSMQITELGGSLRRTQALLYDHLANLQDGYTTKRITLTSPDGSERSEVISIRDRDRARVATHLEPALSKLESIFGSRDAACQAMLAWLATEQEPEAEVAAQIDPAEEVRGGN